MDKYGPLVDIVAIALALVATFSTLLLRILGNIKHWTWLVSGSPSFLVTAGARIVVVVLMAITYVTINKSNYIWFEIVAALIAVFGFWSVAHFDRMRKRHVVAIPLVGANGQPLVDKNNQPKVENVVVGLESQMRPEAKTAYDNTRKQRGGLSLVEFMSGYGSTKLYDPGALWLSEILADISNKLTVTLMFIVLSAVMALFLAAFVINVAI